MTTRLSLLLQYEVAAARDDLLTLCRALTDRGPVSIALSDPGHAAVVGVVCQVTRDASPSGPA